MHPNGVGLGLRWELVDELLATRPALGFVELAPENYIGRGGYYEAILERVVDLWPLATHGLTLSLGGSDPLRTEDLRALRAFLERVHAPWHSDHLCFSTQGGVVLHDLLPLAFQEREVRRVADRIRAAEDALGVALAIENVSFYLHPGKQEMSEPEFVARVCEAADCKLLFDVNNAWVNATNFRYDVDEWLRVLPLERVVQIHVAGHDWFHDGGDFAPGARPADLAAEHGMLIVDTHGADVADEVLAFLERTLARTGPVPVLLERDQAIPPLAELLEEVARIDALYRRVMAAREAP